MFTSYCNDSAAIVMLVEEYLLLAGMTYGKRWLK